MKTILAVVMSLYVSSSAFAAETRWVVSRNDQGACTVSREAYPHASMYESDNSVFWTGQCIEGKANGTGVLEWSKRIKVFGDKTAEIKYWVEEFTIKNGLVVESGELKTSIDFDSIVFDVRGCDPSYSALTAIVPSDLWVQYDMVVSPIMRKAMEVLNSKCPITPRNQNNRNIAVVRKKIETERDANPFGRSAWCEQPKIKDDKSFVCGRFNNDFRADYVSKMRQMEKLLKDKAYSAELENSRVNRIATAEQTDKIRLERYGAFVTKNGVTDLVKPNTLKTNPFVYEGKTIAVELDFSEMLTADRGLFDGVVVSGLPGNLFTVKGTTVVLAGKVLGKTPVKTPFGGEVSAPHLKFIGVHVCEANRCSDILSR
ncbi:MAG: hypothetical protein HY273_06565 [Gammaproteobacteria bacterium]|nr:hypothetical protein [Gammaproteobacteria bacterium]